jgi:hypothetical protein
MNQIDIGGLHAGSVAHFAQIMAIGVSIGILVVLIDTYVIKPLEAVSGVQTLLA